MSATMQTTTTLKLQRGITEAAFGGGQGGTLAVPVAPTATNQLIAIDRVISYTLKWAKPMWDEQFDLDDGFAPSEIYSKGFEPGEIVITSFFQTDDWYDLAIAYTFGTPPTAGFYLDLNDGNIHKTLLGCFIKEWKCGCDAVGDHAIQTITIGFINQMTCALDTAALTWQTGAPSMPADVSATIDGITHLLLSIESMEQVISITWDLDGGRELGSKYCVRPIPTELSVTVDITFKDKAQAALWLADLINDTWQDIASSTVVWGSTLTSTITHLYVEEQPGDRERGLIRNKVTFRGGEAFALS